ncbi:MAG: NHL repeat-containing protein, partial [Candidatus Omnitrophota bacterium]
GIAIDPSGNIWVVNWKNSTVIVLDKTGHLNTAIGQGGIITAEEGKFSDPRKIAIDLSGNIWVTNYGNNTVTVLDKTGQLNTAIGQGGIITAEEGEFSDPNGIAIDPSGNIWVTNRGVRVNEFSICNANDNILVLDKRGQLNTVIPGIARREGWKPKGIAIDPSSNIWILISRFLDDPRSDLESTIEEDMLLVLSCKTEGATGPSAFEASSARIDELTGKLAELEKERAVLEKVPETDQHVNVREQKKIETIQIPADTPVKTDNAPEKSLLPRFSSGVPGSLLELAWIVLTVKNSSIALKAAREISEMIRPRPDGKVLLERIKKMIGKDIAEYEHLFPAAETPPAGFIEFVRKKRGTFFEQAEKLSTLGEPCLLEPACMPRDLILYADDILNNAVFYDFEDAVTKLIKEKNILGGGKIILYTRSEKEWISGGVSKVELLKKLIEKLAPDVPCVMIDRQAAPGGIDTPGDIDTVQEIKDVIKWADNKRLRGEPRITEKGIFAVIRGNSIKWAKTSLKYNIEAPLIIMNDNQRGVFSFYQAMELAIRTLRQEKAFQGWIREFKPVEFLPEKIYTDYIRYRDEVLTKA